jgi:hypothetical protein
VRSRRERAAMDVAEEEAVDVAETTEEGLPEGAGCNSFVAGTRVLLANGKTIPIQRRFSWLDQRPVTTSSPGRRPRSARRPGPPPG